MALIYAYDRETGKKHVIPEEWLVHPHPQFARFTKTPRQRKADGEKPTTTTPQKAASQTKEA